jgi:hypothetical protein
VGLLNKMDKCKRCGRTILGTISIVRKGKLEFMPDFVWGNGNDKFCRYCASTCFFIDGNMYSFEELKKLKEGISPPTSKEVGIQNARFI